MSGSCGLISTGLGILSLAVAGAQNVAPPAPLEPVPTAQQLAWQRLEMAMFLHFGPNTFTDREWGQGTEEPNVFSPGQLDCRQWATVAKETGFGLLVLTAKHHDGFCLWPTKYTGHCVRSSSWRDGKGDVAREFADACQAAGLLHGFYLSPWDRHEPSYGEAGYDDFFCGQIEELLTGYGPVTELWHDGAHGEGSKNHPYPWDRYWGLTRQLSPDALIAICGPDVRWVGNESGVARPNESSVQTRDGKPVWYPAECDVSIRPGWFWHADQDTQVKSLDQLLDIYFQSVGRNSVLLLNVPPNRDGLLADPDVARLHELKAALDAMFATDLAAGAKATADNVRGGSPTYGPEKLLDGDPDSYWATDDGVTTAAVELELGVPTTFNVVRLEEAIALGERVSGWRVEVPDGDGWEPLAWGNVIGHKQLRRVPKTTAQRVRLVIESARACPALAAFGLHFDPRDPAVPSASLAARRPATASNVHSAPYGPERALDDDPGTRWATADDAEDIWLEVDLGQPREIGRVEMVEAIEERVRGFRVEVRDSEDEEWRTCCAGDRIGSAWVKEFTPVTARYVRLHILDATFGPTLTEFRVFAPDR